MQSSWRGTVGVIKPTMRPGSLEEFIRLMPEGVGVIPTFLNIHEGTTSEFQSVMQVVEERVAELWSTTQRGSDQSLLPNSRNPTTLHLRLAQHGQ